MEEEKVTAKNTKNQILDAYNELLKKVEQEKADEPKKVQEQKQKREVTDRAGSLSNEGIVKGISRLKVDLSSSLDQLGDRFVNEFRKFEELQKAIDIEKQNLEELYQLSAGTDSLAAMLLAQKEQKEKFEEEMARRRQELNEQISREREKHEEEMQQKRTLWKREQAERVAAEKEEAASIRKEREREEEEYQYNLKVLRKKEMDVYEEKKHRLERELTDRQAQFEREYQERTANIQEAEAELHELREKSARFPQELSDAVDSAVNQAVDKLKAQHKFELQLREKEVEGELKLKAQTIVSLNAKIKEMETSLKEMAQQTSRAEASVKDIALKAIESRSQQTHYFEKKREESPKEG